MTTWNCLLHGGPPMLDMRHPLAFTSDTHKEWKGTRVHGEFLEFDFYT